MKILMLTPYLPYPDSSGGQIRTQNLLKHLKSEHDITLFSLIKDKSETRYIPILEKNFCKKVQVFLRPRKPFTLKSILNTGFSTSPFVVVRNFSQAAKDAISQELKTNHYDLIHVETFYAMPHLPKTKVPVVLVDQTIEFKVYEHYVAHTAPFFLKPLLYIDVLKLKLAEKYYWRQASRVVAVSQSDAQTMTQIEPGLQVDVVPNGVNLDIFRPKTSWSSKSPKILFIGNFNWMQNTEAAQILITQVMPLVRASLPSASALIVGQHMPASLKKLRAPNVEIKELAEDDQEGIKNAYSHADIFATPLHGPGGTRLKNLAAMASRLPIVSSSVGMSGLGIIPGEHAIIADTPASMAKAIVDLLQNPAAAKKIALAAADFVTKNYDYKVIAKKLSDIYTQLANQ